MRAAELEAGRLSVKALKAELTLLSVPHADAVEKSDLVDRLIQARQLQSSGCDGKSAATFASADTGDDKLSLQELDDALRSAGVEWSPRRVRCLLGLLDVDGDGRVEKEFKKTLEQVATAINAVAGAPISISAPNVQPHKTVDPPTQPAALPSATDLGVSETKLELWRKLGGGDLEPVLASGAVALLDAQWIVSHAEAGGVLTHRQALPKEAFLSLADLVEATEYKYDLAVAALSYPWLTKDHPDPRGANLARVARALKALLSYQYITRLGVFWDFGSLHQHPDPANGVVRTEEQNALFKQGLDCLGMLYSHPHTFVLRLTSFPDGHKAEDQAEGTNVAEYFDRGWCATESAWASLTKGGSRSLDLGKMRDGVEYDRRFGHSSLIDDCTKSGGRRPPLLPSAFAAELETKSFTNGKDDKPLVKRLYEAAFEEQFGKATKLWYVGLGWGDAEAAQLAEVLASGAAPRLEVLDLQLNKIRDEGCKALAAALKEGAAPSLKALMVGGKDYQHELVAVCEERGIWCKLYHH